MIEMCNKFIKPTFFILSCVCLLSCQNKKSINNLEQDNDKNNVEKHLKTKPKFVFVVFYVDEPKLKIEKQLDTENQSAYDLELKYKDYYYCEFEKTNYKSEIQEIKNYNEDKKFKMLDYFESQLNIQLMAINSVFHTNLLIKCKDEEAKELYEHYKCSILDRQIFTYNSYSDASKARQKN